MAVPADEDELLTASFAALSIALTALGAIAVTDGWRPTVLVALAGAAVACTRVRFAAWAAAALLAACAVLALTGRGLVA